MISPWELIGWVIAIPMLMFAGLFMMAIFFASLKAIFKPRYEDKKSHPAKRHLRLVEDD
jgi:hypothetical protein